MDVSAVTTLRKRGRATLVYRLTYHKSKLNSLFRRVGFAALRFGVLSDAAVRENVLRLVLLPQRHISRIRAATSERG